MAKVTITIEDSLDGKGGVKVVADPNFETIMAMDMSGSKLTAAHGYTICALNAIRQAAKMQDDQIKAKIPLIGR